MVATPRTSPLRCGGYTAGSTGNGSRRRWTRWSTGTTRCAPVSWNATACPACRPATVGRHPVDWRAATSAAEVARAAEAEAERPFDLATGPLLRVVVWTLTDTEHVVLAATHHRLRRLVGRPAGRELAAAYAGEPLPDLPVRYVDYAERQRRELDGDRLRADLDYWRDRLAGLPALTLPTDRPAPSDPRTRRRPPSSSSARNWWPACTASAGNTAPRST
ncbi:condensation domain-containing protein [Micromonospora sp. BRA006-A]|nr:condensation domain-containing protein [Micromonospora sp. BRA006-A]